MRVAYTALLAAIAFSLSAGSATAQTNDTFRVFVAYDPPAPLQTDTLGGQVGGWGWQAPPGTAYEESGLVYVRDPGGSRFACEAPANAAELAGQIAYIARGVCEFGLKALNVQNAGAVAFVVHQDNRVPDDDCSLVLMSGGTVGQQVTIPGGFQPRCGAVGLIPRVTATNSLRACLSWHAFGFCPSVVVSSDGDGTSWGPVRVAARPTVFAGTTTVSVRIPVAEHVRVEVFDVQGRRVRVLYDGTLAASLTHRFTFEGAGLPDGVYHVRVTGETFAETRPAVLAR